MLIKATAKTTGRRSKASLMNSQGLKRNYLSCIMLHLISLGQRMAHLNKCRSDTTLTVGKPAATTASSGTLTLQKQTPTTKKNSRGRELSRKTIKMLSTWRRRVRSSTLTRWICKRHSARFTTELTVNALTRSTLAQLWTSAPCN